MPLATPTKCNCWKVPPEQIRVANESCRVAEDKGLNSPVLKEPMSWWRTILQHRSISWFPSSQLSCVLQTSHCTKPKTSCTGQVAFKLCILGQYLGLTDTRWPLHCSSQQQEATLQAGSRIVLSHSFHCFHQDHFRQATAGSPHQRAKNQAQSLRPVCFNNALGKVVSHP